MNQKEQEKANLQQQHLNERNQLDAKHKRKMMQSQKTIADMKDEQTNKEKQWIKEKEEQENMNKKDKDQKTKELQELHTKHREDLAEEKQRHREELK